MTQFAIRVMPVRIPSHVPVLQSGVSYRDHLQGKQWLPVDYPDNEVDKHNRLQQLKDPGYDPVPYAQELPSLMRVTFEDIHLRVALVGRPKKQFILHLASMLEYFSVHEAIACFKFIARSPLLKQLQPKQISLWAISSGSNKPALKSTDRLSGDLSAFGTGYYDYNKEKFPE